MKNHIDKEENVYGFKVMKTKVTDSVLISTKHTFIEYPNDEKIAEMIQQLKEYIKSQHATEKNYPMLNINRLGTSEYEVMVAIATDLLLPFIISLLQKKAVESFVRGIICKIVGKVSFLYISCSSILFNFLA